MVSFFYYPSLGSWDGMVMHFLYCTKPILERIGRLIERIVFKIQNIHKKNTWIYAGLIIGVLWSLWHVPIVFITDSYPQILGVSSFAFWEFLLLFPIQSFIISWVYTKTENSTFTVLIFFLAEITRLFFTLSLPFQITRFVIWLLIAVFILLDELVFHIIPLPEVRKE